MRNLIRVAGFGIVLLLSLMGCSGTPVSEVRHMADGTTGYIAAVDNEGEGTIELMPDGKTVVIPLGADTVPVPDANHPVTISRTAGGYDITADADDAPIGVEHNTCVEDGLVIVTMRVPLEGLQREQVVEEPESGPDYDCQSVRDAA